MDVIVNNVKKEEITFEDFPSICRICLLRGDLRPFEGEDYLLDLFMSITQVDVHSTIDFPRNICNSCVNKLEDISLSIDIWKYNSRPKKEKEAIEDLKVNMMPVCMICSSRSILMSSEANGKLLQLFRNITNIDVRDEIVSSTGNSICSECIDKLEDISSFIRLSLCNNEKLEYAVERKMYVKCETYSEGVGVDSSSCNDLNLEDVTDPNVVLEENPSEKSIFYDEIKKQEKIDIKEHTFDIYVSNSVSRTYQAEVATRSQKFTQKLFPKQDSLYITEEEISQCDWSHEDSTHTSDSREQMLTNRREMFKCGLCGKRFTRKSSWQSHLLSCIGENQFKCDYCEKTFTQKVYLKKHTRTHTRGKPSECYYCKKIFNRIWDLKRHLRTHNEENPFECDLCEKSFSLKANLKIHLRTHTGEKPFKCDICDKSFSHSSSLRTHMLTHSGEKPFKCDCCEKSFNHKGNLKMHSRTHTGEKPFKCDICDKSFTHGSSLRTHMLTHTGEKPFKCDICDKSFSQKGDLIKHLRTHTGEKPFKCDICDKSFSRASTLRTHMLTHTGEKPFKCDCCEKFFTGKAVLKKHLRTHTGEKPFKCDICDKSFSQSSNLRTHMLTHSGEKPFKCDCCEKSFTLKAVLKRHLRTHTGEKLFECVLRKNSFKAELT